MRIKVSDERWETVAYVRFRVFGAVNVRLSSGRTWWLTESELA